MLLLLLLWLLPFLQRRTRPLPRHYSLMEEEEEEEEKKKKLPLPPLPPLPLLLPRALWHASSA